jgi:hypothetical protein
LDVIEDNRTIMPRPWLVTPLTETTEFHNHILITLYTPGKSISVVACKDAYFLEVQYQIAAQMGLTYHDIHLMLNDKTPKPLAKVSSLMGQLEEANYVLEMGMEMEMEMETQACAPQTYPSL